MAEEKKSLFTKETLKLKLVKSLTDGSKRTQDSILKLINEFSGADNAAKINSYVDKLTDEQVAGIESNNISQIIPYLRGLGLSASTAEEEPSSDATKTNKEKLLEELNALKADEIRQKLKDLNLKLADADGTVTPSNFKKEVKKHIDGLTDATTESLDDIIKKVANNLGLKPLKTNLEILKDEVKNLSDDQIKDKLKNYNLDGINIADIKAKAIDKVKLLTDYNTIETVFSILTQVADDMKLKKQIDVSKEQATAAVNAVDLAQVKNKLNEEYEEIDSDSEIDGYIAEAKRFFVDIIDKSTNVADAEYYKNKALEKIVEQVKGKLKKKIAKGTNAKIEAVKNALKEVANQPKASDFDAKVYDLSDFDTKLAAAIADIKVDAANVGDFYTSGSIDSAKIKASIEARLKSATGLRKMEDVLVARIRAAKKWLKDHPEAFKQFKGVFKKTWQNDRKDVPADIKAIISKLDGTLDSAIKYDTLTIDDLNKIEQAIKNYRVSQINAKIDAQPVDADAIISGLPGYKKPVAGETAEQKTKREKENADRYGAVSTAVTTEARTAAHVSATTSDATLAQLEGDDKKIQERIVTEQRRAEALKLNETLAAKKASIEDEKIDEELERLAPLAARHARLESEAEGTDVKYKYTTGAADGKDIEHSLDLFEKKIIVKKLGVGNTVRVGGRDIVVSESTELSDLRLAQQMTELIKIVGEKVAVYDETQKKTVVKNIGDLSAEDLGKLQDKMGSVEARKVFDNDKIAAAVKTNKKEIAKSIAETAGLKGDEVYIAKIEAFIDEITVGIDGNVVSDEELKRVAENAALEGWKKTRVDYLKSLLVNGGKELDTATTDADKKDIANLSLADIEKVIKQVERIRDQLKVSEGTKLNAEDLNTIDKLIADGGNYKGEAKNYLLMLLNAGFTAEQAEKISGAEYFKTLAGMAGRDAINNETVKSGIAQNSAKLKILLTAGYAGAVEISDEDFAKTYAKEIKAYYDSATDAEKKQLETVYQKIVENETKNATDGAVDKLIKVGGTARKSGDEIEFKDDMFAGLDDLDEATLRSLIAEIEAKTELSLQDQETKAKYEMLLAAKKYRAAADKTSVADEVRKAIDKYLVVSELEALAKEIKNAIGGDAETGLKSFSDGTADINDANRDAVIAKLGDLKKAIAEFELKVKKLREVFGIDEELIGKIQSEFSAKEAQNIEQTLDEKLLSDDQKMAAAAETLQRKMMEEDKESVKFNFDIDVYNESLNNVAKGNDASHSGRTMASQVSTMITKPNDETSGYIAAYNAKYGTDAYKNIVDSMKDGKLDKLFENKIFSKQWFKNYAAGIVGAIISVLASVRTKETLSEEDKLNYAHIQIVVEANSIQLYMALAEVLGADRFKEFEKLIKREFRGSDMLFACETSIQIGEKLAAKLKTDLGGSVDEEIINQLVSWLIDNKFLKGIASATSGKITLNDAKVAKIVEALKAGKIDTLAQAVDVVSKELGKASASAAH